MLCVCGVVVAVLTTAGRDRRPRGDRLWVGPRAGGWSALALGWGARRAEPPHVRCSVRRHNRRLYLHRCVVLSGRGSDIRYPPPPHTPPTSVLIENAASILPRSPRFIFEHILMRCIKWGSSLPQLCHPTPHCHPTPRHTLPAPLDTQAWTRRRSSHRFGTAAARSLSRRCSQSQSSPPLPPPPSSPPPPLPPSPPCDTIPQ